MMSEKNPFDFSVSVAGICFCAEKLWGASVRLMLLAFHPVSLESQPQLHPDQGNPGYFTSPLFIIIFHYLSCNLGVIMHLGNYVSCSRPLEIYLVCRSYNLQNSPRRKKGGSRACKVMEPVHHGV